MQMHEMRLIPGSSRRMCCARTCKRYFLRVRLAHISRGILRLAAPPRAPVEDTALTLGTMARRTAAQSRAMPLRARARTQPTRAVSEAESAARRERSAILTQQRRHRRLLELGATCFPRERTAVQEPGVATEQAISHVLLQSASDANAPPVAQDRQVNRTSASVRRLLATRRGANALLEEAASLGQLQSMPDFVLPAGRYPARPLCGVCGYWGDLRCMSCGERFCCNRCGLMYVCSYLPSHKETRCERPVW